MIIDTQQRIKTLSYPSVIKTKPAGLFYVALKDNINPLGFSFEKPHPFTEVIRAYQNDPSLNPKDSIMATLYEGFKPKNLKEAFGLKHNHTYLASLSSKIYHVPWLDKMPTGGFGEGLDIFNAVFERKEKAHGYALLSE